MLLKGSMEKCSAMQEELDESDSDEEPGESDCDEQELRVENKEDCSDVPIQLLKERNIISGVCIINVNKYCICNKFSGISWKTEF